MFKTVTNVDSQFARVQMRLAVSGASDLDAAMAILKQFTVQNLSSFLDPQMDRTVGIGFVDRERTQGGSRLTRAPSLMYGSTPTLKVLSRPTGSSGTTRS